MQMLGFSGQLLRSCHADFGVFWAVAKELLCRCWGFLGSCQGVAMQMLGFSGQLLKSCYADVGVFWAVAKELLCRCWGFLGSC